MAKFCAVVGILVSVFIGSSAFADKWDDAIASAPSTKEAAQAGLPLYFTNKLAVKAKEIIYDCLFYMFPNDKRPLGYAFAVQNNVSPGERKRVLWMWYGLRPPPKTAVAGLDAITGAPVRVPVQHSCVMRQVTTSWGETVPGSDFVQRIMRKFPVRCEYKQGMCSEEENEYGAQHGD